MSSKLVATLGADHVLIEDVPSPARYGGNRHELLELCSGDRLGVVSRVALARGRPVVEILELDDQYRGLQLVEAEIAADHGVVVLRLPTMHAQDLQLLRENGVVRRAHARVAERAEILRREERQATDVADATRASAIG